MDYAPAFQMGHPIAFELANRLAKIAPPGLDRIFFTNSGSESVDTALKIAIALSPCARRRPAHPLHRPRKGLSRRGFRRHVGRRHGQQPQVLRLLDAARRGSSVAYAGYRTQRVLARTAAMGRASGQRTGAPDRSARCIDHRRGHRRAHRRIGRRGTASRRLPEAAARDLRQARHSVDFRRSDHGIRPRRQAVRRARRSM